MDLGSVLQSSYNVCRIGRVEAYERAIEAAGNVKLTTLIPKFIRESMVASIRQSDKESQLAVPSM